ncbi:MAG: hypothetical protein EWM72_00126 [Nitrospira sp.]|nr:MAG: hypothetical protein EWM72_00126 [Nitrospira sp.]
MSGRRALCLHLHISPHPNYWGIVRLVERASEPLLHSPLAKMSDREADGPHVRRSVQQSLERTKFVGHSEDEAYGDQQGSGLKREQPDYPPPALEYPSPIPVQCCFLGACPTLTVLLWRTMPRHLHCSRPRKILNVFQRIRLRLLGACGRVSAWTSFASSRTATSERLLPTPWLFE